MMQNIIFFLLKEALKGQCFSPNAHFEDIVYNWIKSKPELFFFLLLKKNEFIFILILILLFLLV